MADIELDLNSAFKDSVSETPRFRARMSTHADLEAVIAFFKSHTDPNVHIRTLEAIEEACKKGRVIILKDSNDKMIGMSARYAHNMNGFSFQELGSVMIDKSATRQGLSSQMVALQVAAAYFLDKEKPNILVADFVEGNLNAQDMFRKLNWKLFDDAGAIREQCYTTHTEAFEGKTNWCMFSESDLFGMARKMIQIFTSRNNLTPVEPLFTAYNRLVEIALSSDERPDPAHFAAIKAAQRKLGIDRAVA